MSSKRKCKNCGSAEIEVDSGRGDAVCTACGSVLEMNIIVAEVQFEEGAHGNASAVGQFVSADSKGGATKFGASFHVGSATESREITQRKARYGITNLCQQLQLNQHCIDTACSFFKMALNRGLTKGRRNSHIHAACVYLTCRTEGTAHLLIDISDVLQICCFELGKTYLKLSQALCINIPAMDPCLYILRYAGGLDFGPKTQLVANTALRLVQRMKRDSIHSGRRPSGLCGAALLIAARLHDFGRTTGDVIRVVKVHESTLKKRLFEFGETPSSALTLEEFMTVDLEEEQDPPAFKAARRKDKDRLQKIIEDNPDCVSQLQREIDVQLRKDCCQKRFSTISKETSAANHFINDLTLQTINTIIDIENVDIDDSDDITSKELGPDCANMGLATSLYDTSNVYQTVPLVIDTSLRNLDDDELDSYILTDLECKNKSDIWDERYGEFLKEQQLKAEKRKQEQEDSGNKQIEKKKQRRSRSKPIGPTSSAGEAIEKILQEKKLSTKINYDVLKSLNMPSSSSGSTAIAEMAAPQQQNAEMREESIQISRTSERLTSVSVSGSSKVMKPKQDNKTSSSKRKKSIDKSIGMPIVANEQNELIVDKITEEDIMEDDYYDDEQVGDVESKDNGIADLLRQHRSNENDEGNDDYYGYDDEY